MWAQTLSTCCSIIRATTTTCSRHRIPRCPRSITRSDCTRAAWCATAAHCRSASANSATPSSIRCCCATSRTKPGGSALADMGTERSAALIDCRRRPRTIRHRPVRRDGDVRRPDARPVSRGNSPPPRLRLSTFAARAGRERLEHARRRGAARGPARRRRGPRCSTNPTSPRLKAAGVLRSETRFDDGQHRLARGRPHRGQSRQLPSTRAALARDCLGLNLQGGTVMHAGFLLGPRAFYAALCALPESERRLFDMRGVGYINQLYGDDFSLRVAQRCHARFVNTTMMLTTLGAAVSDGLDDGRVVSGVGGQYNFVAMAHALPGARSVLCARATRRKDGTRELQHRYELRPHDHSAPSARSRHHRIRHRRPARPHRRRMHRRDAEHR